MSAAEQTPPDKVALQQSNDKSLLKTVAIAPQPSRLPLTMIRNEEARGVSPGFYVFATAAIT
jgi:hypothetical protein